MARRPSQIPRQWCFTCMAAVCVLGASLLLPLPDAAREVRSVQSIRVTDRSGLLLREVRPEGRGIPVELDRLPPFIRQAVIAAEDRAFYRHIGVDPVAVGRAFSQLVRSGRVVSGASTITMQVARLLRGRSGPIVLDKLAEIHLALRLELRLTKEDILTLWLNRAYFGSQAYGIESASQTYFGKSARDLTITEGALIVGLAQSPSRYDPFRRMDRALTRRDYVLEAMEDEGFLGAEERARIAALEVDLAFRTPPFDAPHLVGRVTADGFDAPRVPLEIRTTIDRTLQRDVTGLAMAHLETLEQMQAGNAAVLVLENATGDVVAYVGNPDFWDEPGGGQNDGVRMLRQPGSALKPFTYGLALSLRDYTAATILADVETPVLEAGGAFSPENYDRRFHGPVPLRTALASSYNVPAVRLAMEVGPEALLETLHRAGFRSLDRPARRYGVGLTLGNGEVSLEELAYAYAGLAGGGTAPVLRLERLRRWASGDTSHTAPAHRSIGLSEEVAFLLTDILRDPQAREPAFGRGGPLELPFPCAVKTGTSKNYRDNWAVGFTPRHTVAVWVGNFDGTPMRTVAGVSGAGALLKAIFLRLGAGGEFAAPPSIERATICPVSGKRPSRICPTRRTEVFVAGTVPVDTCDVHRRYAIDVRSGTLADPATPGAFVAERVYEEHPPVFHEWMRREGIAFPPRPEGAGSAFAGTGGHDAEESVVVAELGASASSEGAALGDVPYGARSEPGDAGASRRVTSLRGNGEAGDVSGRDRIDRGGHAGGELDGRVADRSPGGVVTSGAAAAPKLAVAYPESGMVFQIDAVLRREYQRIEPRAHVAPEMTDVAWWLDGEVLGSLADEPTILLRPGRHTLVLRARDVRGRPVESREVIFVVLGLEPIAAAPTVGTSGAGRVFQSRGQ